MSSSSSHLVFLVEGDDHERDVVIAANENDARSGAADAWHERYYDPEEGDDATYTGEEFTIIAVYPDGSDIDPFLTPPAGALATWPGQSTH